MKNKIFEVGDKVYDAIHGWGKITSINYATVLPITVQFRSDRVFYTVYGATHPWAVRPTLSFEEYGFDNRFTQKRFINSKDYISKWGKFWNNKDKELKNYMVFLMTLYLNFVVK